MRRARTGSIATAISGSASRMAAKSRRATARQRTHVEACTRAVRVTPDARIASSPKNSPGPSVTLPRAGQLHRDGALLQEEHARSLLTRLGEDVTGGRLELGHDRADAGERVVVEIGEDRDRAELRDQGVVHARQPTRAAYVPRMPPRFGRMAP